MWSIVEEGLECSTWNISQNLLVFHVKHFQIRDYVPRGTFFCLPLSWFFD